MERTGAIHTTLRRAVSFADRAKQALMLFPPSVMRQRLLDVADYTVRRGR
jgi:geranylgeranyl pyrophosphate synthase